MSHNNVHGLSSISQELSDSLNIYMKLFILLYADDTILFSDCPEDLQTQLDTWVDQKVLKLIIYRIIGLSCINKLWCVF